ncbi:MAG: hypothetical protein EA381_09175 [Planctomycetaceae bacterium]|nr:MAG: hypothetical protein EA381_09175 [Planctomycetaceae bacterium]
MCRIEVIDEANGWPVPLVELRTTHHVRLVTDNAGLIALDQPELMGVETWFSVIGHGYEVAPDGFGYRGVRLVPRAGERLVVKVSRRLPAKRLGRLTGAGLFGESQKLGEQADWQESRVFGCDSVQLAIHRGRAHWAWGDTTLGRYPLGRFHMIGATTKSAPWSSPEPPIRPNYQFFRDQDGLPRNIGEMSGPGPTWISGLVSLPDASGRERLVGTYIKVKPPLTAYEAGLCVWDDEQQRFERQRVLWTATEADPEPPRMPDGHALIWPDGQGRPTVWFGDPFPRLRMAATWEAWSDPAAWEDLEPQELVPSESGRLIRPHRGSIAWNAYRGCWVGVFTELGGEGSHLGEIWYAEADRPTGPWGSAIRVVTHEDYTFYNPRLHPDWGSSGSSVLLFEGTYTQQFSGNSQPTPRYDYNQILYRIDLDELSNRSR